MRRPTDVFLTDNAPTPELPMLILTDSADMFSDSRNGRPRSVDKHTRVAICYVRDGLGIYNICFLEAWLNI